MARVSSRELASVDSLLVAAAAAEAHAACLPLSQPLVSAAAAAAAVVSAGAFVAVQPSKTSGKPQEEDRDVYRRHRKQAFELKKTRDYYYQQVSAGAEEGGRAKVWAPGTVDSAMCSARFCSCKCIGWCDLLLFI